jgi:cytidine deaminase
MIDERVWESMKRAATRARANAHAPYSRFQVGAAIKTPGGIYTGCNVENASFGATMCAERAALAAAVADGERELQALVIVSGAKAPTPPCGICRQCLVELAKDLPIRSYAEETQADYSLASLLPKAFDRVQLE